MAILQSKDQKTQSGRHHIQKDQHRQLIVREIPGVKAQLKAQANDPKHRKG